MSVHRAPRLLVAVTDSALEARLLRHLKPLTRRVWTLAAPPVDEQLDCIVTDDPAAFDLAAVCGTRWADVRPAIIVLTGRRTDVERAADQRADARLPPTARARELRLACRLLTRVARLRRRASQHTHRHRRLARLAATDPLTGLPNRRAWNRELRRRLRELSGAGAADRRLCLAILDLDHFKRLNDGGGHVAGDAALRAAAAALQAGIRQTDFVARLGGDEFGLLADVAGASAADRLVERVRRAMQTAPTTVAAPITASAGYAIAQPGAEAQAIVAAADMALREAKAAGRDTSRGVERNPR